MISRGEPLLNSLVILISLLPTYSWPCWMMWTLDALFWVLCLYIKYPSKHDHFSQPFRKWLSDIATQAFQLPLACISFLSLLRATLAKNLPCHWSPCQSVKSYIPRACPKSMNSCILSRKFWNPWSGTLHMQFHWYS